MTVQLTNVGRRFGSIVALHAATIHAPAGEITVLLGPNGAGKTTAIRMITGALAADDGEVRVFGVDPTGPDGESVRRRCGVVTAKPSLYDRLNGMDNLRYAAELFGLGRGSPADERIVAAATQFGIEDSLENEVGGYSTGMKTRLALARAVLHEPELLLLDEPTSGLDPESAAAVLEMIREMTIGGRTVLMCTHLLLEAEGLADRIVVMDDGTTAVSGAPDALAATYCPDRIVTVVVEGEQHASQLDTARGHRAVEGYDRQGTRARLTLHPQASEAALLADLVGAGIPISAFEPYRPSLEDLYFAIRRSRRAAPPAVASDRSGTRDEPPEVEPAASEVATAGSAA